VLAGEPGRREGYSGLNLGYLSIDSRQCCHSYILTFSHFHILTFANQFSNSCLRLLTPPNYPNFAKQFFQMIRKQEVLQDVVIKFAGDSGDGMQLTGTQFTNNTALLGIDLSTF